MELSTGSGTSRYCWCVLHQCRSSSSINILGLLLSISIRNVRHLLQAQAAHTSKRGVMDDLSQRFDLKDVTHYDQSAATCKSYTAQTA